MIGMLAWQDRRKWRLIGPGVGAFRRECQINPTQLAPLSHRNQRRGGGELWAT